MQSGPEKEGDEERPDRFAIVGLGASAGGLGALESFFSDMPTDSGVAFVVVTHQHAEAPSLLAELLDRKTAMPVVQVTESTRVEPNHVYTSKPGYNLAIIGGVLQPMELDQQQHPHMPVDYFFRSLAQDQRELAVAIILSGTGSDGSLGVKDIKGELGMVMVQSEQSAEYAGMPRAAIATRLVDYVLPVSEMGQRLLAYLGAATPGGPAKRTTPPVEALQQIFVLIRSRTGHDFSQYKGSTIGRRIERRMNVHHLGTVQEYVGYLQTNPGEIDLLFKELLIGVTSFFRDPEAWEALAPLLRDLLAEKPDDYVVRLWVAGCSTGEEAYSLAILLRESMDALQRSLSVQIFATDLDADAIDVARAGIYPFGIANDISGPRLARFFTQEDDNYRVKKEIREMVVFAPQNIIGDPPFTKLDLLSCRNLLIYLEPKLQQRLIPIFHYALRPNGILFLGSSESIGAASKLFAPLDRKWKTFRRKEAIGAYAAAFPVPMVSVPAPAPSGPVAPSRGASFDRLTQNLLLKELVPATALVHQRGDIVYLHGKTGQFLDPPEGAPASANIFNMARDGLSINISTAIRQATATKREVVHRGIKMGANDEQIRLDLRVQRIRNPEPLRGLFRITFEHARPVAVDAVDALDAAESPDQLAQLARELQYAKESHQSTFEELETANEELKSSNEELQSTNEELQSANEELGTSKEETQSLNEELQTVNAELQGKVEELSAMNNDMKNLLNGTNIATVFLDNDLKIKRFTEQAKTVIRLIASDVGRPVGDLASTLHYDQLVEDADEVLRTLVFREREVQSDDGTSYLMRMLPYRTVDNVIDGLVLTFVDVTQFKTLQDEQERLVAELQRSPAHIFGQDLDLRFTWAGNEVFGHPPGEIIGKTDADLFEPAVADQLREEKMTVLATERAARHQLTATVGGESRTYDLYIEPRRAPSGQINGLSCVALDVTSFE